MNLSEMPGRPSALRFFMNRKLPEIQVDPGFCLLLAGLLLLVPLPWILAAMAAAGFHELCHIFVILLLNGSFHSLSLGSSGARIRTGRLDTQKEFLSAAAGPAGSFLLGFLFLHTLPKLALCALCQGSFNLLPLYPLDGGRMLSCLLRMLWGRQKGDRLRRIIQRAVLCLILTVGFGLSIYPGFRLYPALLSLILVYKLKNIPCQDGG